MDRRATIYMSNLQQFFSWPECLSRQHCEACRSTGNDNFRRKICTFLQADSGETDFACPHGKPWGFVPDGVVVYAPPVIDERQRELNELADERRRVCKLGCEHFAHLPGLGRCTLQHPDEAKACPCAAWFRDPASKCPMDKWTAILPASR